MNSERASLIATDPFIRKFVYAIIQNIRAQNFQYEERQVIHADLVPKVSERVMQASMEKPKVIAPPKPHEKTLLVFPKAVVHHKPKMPMPPPHRMIAPPPMPMPMPQIGPPSAPQGASTELSQDYGKITPLLNDPSVSTIECHGEGKPVMIIRAGQRQTTKISLSAKDIKEVLTKVSEAVHIPLLEGVFRAAVDNFSINAVISEIIGSRFVIKKQTAYSLLEK